MAPEVTRLSLDATVGDGLALHEIIAAPVPIEDDATEPAESSPAVLATLACDLLEVRALDHQAREAELEAVRRRGLHERRVAELEARTREYIDAEQYAALVGLSQAQLRVVHARITLAQNGEPVTHHAVARMLGVRPATVSKQWARIQAKLSTAPVSTSAA